MSQNTGHHAIFKSRQPKATTAAAWDWKPDMQRRKQADDLGKRSVYISSEWMGDVTPGVGI